MPRIQRNDVRVKDIRGALNAAIVRTGQDYENEFLPEASLFKLVDADTVAAVLQSNPDVRCPNQQTEDRVLAEYFAQNAPKVFAVLVRTSLLHHMEYLYRKRVLDKMLPINLVWRNYSKNKWDVKSYDKSTDDEKIGQVFGCDVDAGAGNPWDDETIERFFDGQWPLVPARFDKDKFRYNFPEPIRLPFTWVGNDVDYHSKTSWVREERVHADYFPKGLEFTVPIDDQNSFRVAVKKIQKSGSFENVAKEEAEMLEFIRGLKSSHLIKAVAYYNIRQDHYFMFPWAEMGNLWGFWEKTERQSTSAREYVRWMVTQLAGLAGAIEELHHHNRLHGDLKPLNILCFRAESDPDKPHLVITDVGAAVVLDEETHGGRSNFGIQATTRYAAPELTIRPEVPRSRRFDVWSLGCIFLEFVCWAMYGMERLSLLREQVEEYYKTTESMESFPVTRRWFFGARSTRHRKKTTQLPFEVNELFTSMNQECRLSKFTTMGQLVDLIQHQMLVVKLNSRADAGEIRGWLESIL
ncbi:kinase-like domain-containing protein [Nemania sp. FL0031]|nr:kinase-like domain-containing protein [Nemania sp. FL0031]